MGSLYARDRRLTTAHASKASPNFSLIVQVIIEHEFLEQAAETSEQWSLSRSVEFIGRYKDPWPVLRALHQDKCLTLVDRNGNSLPTRKAEEIFRNRGALVGMEVTVKVTEAGVKR